MTSDLRGWGTGSQSWNPCSAPIFWLRAHALPRRLSFWKPGGHPGGREGLCGVGGPLQRCRGALGEPESCRPLLGSRPGANMRKKLWARLEVRVCFPGVGAKPSPSVFCGALWGVRGSYSSQSCGLPPDALGGHPCVSWRAHPPLAQLFPSCSWFISCVSAPRVQALPGGQGLSLSGRVRAEDTVGDGRVGWLGAQCQGFGGAAGGGCQPGPGA